MKNPAFLAVLVVYSVGLVGLGLALSRYVKTAGDFFVAGRKLSAPLIFTTFLAANIGAGSTVGATGLGYQLGLSAWWWVGSAGIGSLLLAFFVGPRIYALAARHNLYTVGDYLEHRYSRRVRLFFAAVLWVGSLAILAGQLIAIASILNVVAGLPKPVGCVLGGAVITAYFVAGGLFTSVWVNLVQLTVKMLGFAIAVPYAVWAAGGWAALRASSTQPPDYFRLTGIGLEGIVGYAVILIPSFIVSPGLLQKLYGARDERAVRWGVAAQALALLAYAVLPALLGIAARSAFAGITDRDLVLPTALTEMLPQWLGALLLAAVFSAEISAADAVLFMLSTSVAKDFYMRVWNPQAGDAELLRATRWSALAAGVAGTGAAIVLPSVIDALTIFYGLLAAALFVPLLAGLYSRRPTAPAALAAMILGLTMTLAAHVATGGKGWGILTPYAAGIAASALCLSVLAVKPNRT